MSLLVNLVAVSVVIAVPSSIDFSEFNPIQIAELKDAYYRVLDHNNDNIVDVNELRLGVLAELQSDIQLDDSSIFTSYIPEQYTCIPSLTFIDFADCLTLAARLYSKKTNSTGKPISFEDAFTKYIGTCNDISPVKDAYCSDIVEKSPESCMIWSRTNQPFCKISCYSCNEESLIFTDEPIRGLNGKYSPRIERFSTADMQYHVNTDAANNCTAIKADNHTGQILFVSDIHIEPWYNVDGTGGVSRFAGANSGNMFECRDKSNKEVPCTLNGVSDPPENLWKTGMQFLAKHAVPSDLSQDILIMPGDTQAHSYNDNVNGSNSDASELQTVPALMNKVVDYMLTFFKADNIFYAAGNNDGQHDIIFCSGSNPAINSVWANVLISNKIVNNDLKRTYTYNNKVYDQVQLFNQTGYYIKKIPEVFNKASDSENFYAIILNTNMGTGNAFQNAVFNDDLAWVQAQNSGHVLVIGHHPSVVPKMIPSKYQALVRGSFAGHVHKFQPSDSNGFAIIPCTTQTTYVGVITGDLNNAGKVVLNWNENFNQFFGEKHTLPQENCWGYNGKP